MPEGDTVFRAAAKLNRGLAGERLARAEIRWGSKTIPDVIGRRTLEVIARGKHILHRIEGGVTVHSHLRMEGNWRILDNDRLGQRELYNPSIRAIFATEQVTAIGRKLGMLDVLPTSKEATLVGHLGPDILGPDWDLEQAIADVAVDPRPIGEVLLDQRVLAGIGTMYDAETLFIEKIPPWTPAADLGPDVVRRIIERAYRLLMAGKEDDVQSTTGSRRRGEEKFVHARSGRPCRRCGTTLRVAMIGQAPQDRTIFYCPTCQGGIGPTDDAKPQSPLGHPARPIRRRGGYR